MKEERVLILIKPDGLIKSLTGDVISKLSETNLRIVGAKIVNVSKELAEQHYAHLKESKPKIFEETLKYKEELTRLYGLKVESIGANKIDNDFTTRNETWKTTPEFCCDINKVRPLSLIKQRFNLWVSGLMEWQSDHRSTLDIFELRNGILKFYPLLDVSKEEREVYIKEHKLPFHPLVAKGYSSVGCKHCTVPGEGRSGRWNNHPKTECGLHL